MFAGCLLKALGRRLQHLALLHYVDDYFSPDREECVAVAMDTFARLVRACFGETAVSHRKLEWGNPLCVLGIMIELQPDGAVYWPSEDQIEKWSAKIRHALHTGTLCSGEALKLSGRQCST